ncbi:PqiC family protein [Castellaniella defragrans]|uniref:ABC-type transport auxiliary lipoprotein component domain-containing protein n=1 Tax=Castellaniella defragrans TaxID=75697 RepID=A0A7W9WN28_CASDE|nr:PqiC family protein [Castellaniella defragrans]KAB0615989.1 membrane integrity-associated transporter subunit PqiC [Castellaniella defragrans]MBB6082325.1 hypothetical protein [Castellaniella defragrans]
MSVRGTISTWGRLLGLAALLAGCAVAPPRYYSLAAPAAGLPASTAGTARAAQGDQAAQGDRGVQPASASPAPRAAGTGLRLSVARIPAEAERPQLVVRDPARGPAVQVLNDSLWAAPLGDQIRDALAAEVGRRLGAADLQRLPDAGSRPARRIEVRIDRFDMVWDRFVALEADWTDRAPGADRIRLCRAAVRLPAGAGVASLVEAQRGALDRLAALIAAAASDSTADLQGKPTVSEFGCT